MKKPSNKFSRLFIAVPIVFIICIIATIACKSQSKPKEKEYYISLGRSAKAFHVTKECYGLRNSKKVISVTWEEAVNKYHRRPCKWCFDKEYFDYPNYGD
ncbi:MAG: hypothetical protein IKA04_10970 [Alistipes sp.]|nr:hypothetical protein [Alistipes sp.]